MQVTPGVGATSLKKVRLYIDGENMSSALMDQYLAIGKEQGEIISKKVYGDFTNPSLTSWKGTVKDYGMDPIHVTSTGKGKSTTDIKLIVDLLSDFYDHKDDVYILISNDNDFVEVGKKILSTGGTIISINKQNDNGPLSHSFTTAHSVRDVKSEKTNKTKSESNDINKVIAKITLIIEEYSKNNKPTQLSQLTTELYKSEGFSKSKVKKAIGYSSKEGITGALKKRPEFTIKKVSGSVYIELTDSKSVAIPVKPKKKKAASNKSVPSSKEVEEFVKTIKVIINNAPQKKMVKEYVLYELVTMELFKKKGITKKYAVKILGISSYNKFLKKLPELGFEIKMIKKDGKQVRCIKCK